MIYKYQKEIQTKLAKNLLDTIILQYLDKESMHGYQLITKIRKDFGVYLGPSTIYPLLGLLEKKAYVKSAWNMNTDRPRKVYTLTADGKSILKLTEDSLNLICKSLAVKAGLKADDVTLQVPTQRMMTCRQ
jgi:DNA-binding PadR family transcriptional regulator